MILLPELHLERIATKGTQSLGPLMGFNKAVTQCADTSQSTRHALGCKVGRSIYWLQEKKTIIVHAFFSKGSATEA